MIVVMIENSFIIYLALIIVGLCMGSFVGATVWRFRAVLLEHDKKNGEKINENEYKKLKKLSSKSFLKDRSVCLNCSYKLKWYDLIPVFSWLSLSGKCRKCKKPIGYLEPILEIAMASFFLLSFIFWPSPLDSTLSILQFIIWLIAGVVLAIIFVYDMKWLEIPTILNYLFIILGLLYTVSTLFGSTPDSFDRLLSLSISILILSGLYLFIYFASKKRWIGFGDGLLGLGMALFLIDWELSYIALFSANFIGCLVILPGMLTGKLKRTSKIPFGPFLILGLILAKLLGYQLIQIFSLGYL